VKKYTNVAIFKTFARYGEKEYKGHGKKATEMVI
jgi:hypothetical protein